MGNQLDKSVVRIGIVGSTQYSRHQLAKALSKALYMPRELNVTVLSCGKDVFGFAKWISSQVAFASPYGKRLVVISDTAPSDYVEYTTALIGQMSTDDILTAVEVMEHEIVIDAENLAGIGDDVPRDIYAENYQRTAFLQPTDFDSLVTAVETILDGGEVVVE